MVGGKNQLLYVQVDRVDGESAGHFIEEIYAAGANNVQLIPSLTKKGRPGYLLFIDVSKKSQPEIERILVEEFCVSGWHVISSRHVFKKTTIKEKGILINGKGWKFEITIPYKIIEESNAVFLEHDFCVEMQKEIKQKFSESVSLINIKKKLKNALTLNENKIYI